MNRMPKSQTREALLEEQSPERALLVKIGKIENRHDVARVAEEIEEQQERGPLALGKIAELTEALNRRHVDLINAKLLARTGKREGYTFRGLGDLTDIRQMIEANPLMSQVDQQHYAKVWAEIESHAPALIREEIQASVGNYTNPLHYLSRFPREIEGFEFSNENARMDAYRALDEAYVEGVQKVVRYNLETFTNPIHYLNNLRQELERVTLTNVELQAAAHGHIDNALVVSAGKVAKSDFASYADPLHYLSNLRGQIERSTFTEEDAQKEAYELIDATVRDGVRKVCKSNLASYSDPLHYLADLRSRVDRYSFTDGTVGREAYQAIDDTAVAGVEKVYKSIMASYPRSAAHYLNDLSKKIERFPFFEESSRERAQEVVNAKLNN